MWDLPDKAQEEQGASDFVYEGVESRIFSFKIS